MLEAIQWNFEAFSCVSIRRHRHISQRVWETKLYELFQILINLDKKRANVYFWEKSWNRFLVKKLRLHNMNSPAKQWPNTLIFGPECHKPIDLLLTISLTKISSSSKRDHGSCSKHCNRRQLAESRRRWIGQKQRTQEDDWIFERLESSQWSCWKIHKRPTVL